MKISKRLIFPIASIIILGLYLGINNTGKMNYKIPVVDTIDEKEIDRITIMLSSESIDLHSDNGVWRISPENHRADPSKIAEILSLISNPEFIDMVSDTENYYNYGLDDGEYISLEAWVSENTTEIPDRELFIGALNITSNFTFIRKPDNPSVFTVRGNTRGFLDTSVKDLIDKRTLDFDTREIDKIELTFANTKYMLKKTVGTDNKDVWNTEEGISIDTNNLYPGLRYLSNSRFDSYIDNVYDSSSENIFEIHLYGKNLDSSFMITEKNDEGYYCKSSFAGKSFFLSENTGTQIMKMFGELIE